MPKAAYKPKYPIPSLEDAIAFQGGRIAGIHEACLKVPMISARCFDVLVEDIMRRRLIRPIEIDDQNLVLDGRCRLLASYCANLKIPDEMICVTECNPWDLAAINNARRHLSENEILIEAHRVYELEKEEAAKRKADGPRKRAKAKEQGLEAASGDKSKKRMPRAADIAAESTGVSRAKLQKVDKVLKNPAVAARFEAGELDLDQAAEECGVKRRKSKEVKAQPAADSVSHTSDVKEEATPESTVAAKWNDSHVAVYILKGGIRKIVCKSTTQFVFLANFSIVHQVSGQWQWFTSLNRSGTSGSREEAESQALKRLPLPKILLLKRKRQAQALAK